MDQSEIAALGAAVETNFSGCSAAFRQAVDVSESFHGQVAWEHTVAVFDLSGHPSAKVCYAWSEAVPPTERRRFFTVLEAGPVRSPRDAVLASLAADARWPGTSAREGERIALAIAALRGESRFADAVSLADSYDLGSAPPEVKTSVLLQAFYAAHEGKLREKARKFAALLAEDDPDLPSIQDYL